MRKALKRAKYKAAFEAINYFMNNNEDKLETLQKHIDKIFEDHEAQLKAKDEEIETWKTEFKRMQDIAIKKDVELCKALEYIEELKNNKC